MEQYPDETMMLLITKAKDYPVPFLLAPWGEYDEAYTHLLTDLYAPF